MKDKINVAILLNDRKIPFWIYTSIAKLVNSSVADITLVISRKPSETFASGNQKGFGPVLLKLIEKIDYLIFKTEYNYDFLKNVSGLKGKIDIYDLNYVPFDANIVQHRLNQTILEIKPDLIVKFGVHYLSETLHSITRYGIWSFSIDSDNIPGGFDYGFWEVFRYRETSYSYVEITGTKTEPDVIIFGSSVSTCPFSINKNRNNVFFRTSLFLPRLIEGLHLYGDEYLLKLKQHQHKLMLHDMDKGRSTTTCNVLGDIVKYILRVSKWVINKIFYTDAFSWKILINCGINEDFSSDSFSKFKTLQSPQYLFWADPFVVSENNHYYLFVEEYIYKKDKGHITMIELDSQCKIIKHQKIIEKSYHMSYPFLFREKEIYYMIPETASNRTIELYRCTEFPGKWELDRYLMKDIYATDTTLFYYNKKWWLFTTLDQTDGISGGSTELFLFFADSPFTDSWTSHPLNPIVSDERIARCAGNLFIRDKKIYRPSQDCSVRYGRGLNINRIIKLNEHEYEEELVREIKPGWSKKIKGMHTVNLVKDLIIIDTYEYHKRISF